MDKLNSLGDNGDIDTFAEECAQIFREKIDAKEIGFYSQKPYEHEILENVIKPNLYKVLGDVHVGGLETSENFIKSIANKVTWTHGIPNYNVPHKIFNLEKQYDEESARLAYLLEEICIKAGVIDKVRERFTETSTLSYWLRGYAKMLTDNYKYTYGEEINQWRGNHGYYRGYYISKILLEKREKETLEEELDTLELKDLEAIKRIGNQETATLKEKTVDPNDNSNR